LLLLEEGRLALEGGAEAGHALREPGQLLLEELRLGCVVGAVVVWVGGLQDVGSSKKKGCVVVGMGGSG
jgi:hypothetical protein